MPRTRSRRAPTAARKVGAIGDATCFSFYANKNLAAGEGGMLTLRDEPFADRVRSLRLHGLDRDAWKRYKRQGPGRYDVVEPGYKYNLSDLHAGVALGQLHRLEEHHARRAAQTARYDEGLAGLPGITPIGRKLGPGVAPRPPPVRRSASMPSSPAAIATPTPRRCARPRSGRACTSSPSTS